MDLNESLKWDGTLKFKVIKDGKVVREYKEQNKMTNYARGYIAQMLAGSIQGPLILPSQIELGTGSGTAAATDTDLWSSTIATMKPCSYTQVYLNYFAQYIVTWLTTDPIQGTWTEAGLKDVNGNLWAHTAFNLTINPGEMLVGQWQVQIVGN